MLRSHRKGRDESAQALGQKGAGGRKRVDGNPRFHWENPVAMSETTDTAVV